MSTFEQHRAEFVAEVRAALVAEGNRAELVDAFIAWANERDYFADRDNSYGCVDDATLDFHNWSSTIAPPNLIADPCNHSEWAPACPVCGATHAAIAVGESDKARRFLVVAYDVTDLNEKQINNLEMHVSAQAEASDTGWAGDNLEDYPNLVYKTQTVEVLP